MTWTARQRVCRLPPADLGLAKGDRIVIQMPNLLQYPVALFGALRAGLVVVNANPLYTVNEMARVLRGLVASRDRGVGELCRQGRRRAPREFDRARHHHRGRGPSPPTTPQHRQLCRRQDQADGSAYDLPQAVPFRTALARGRDADFVDPGVVPADTAFLQYTGGTTGGPKAAILTHWNLLNNQEQFMGQVRNTLGEDKQSIVIAALPLYHVFALTVNCLGFFRFGAHNVLVTNPRDMPGFVKTLKATKPDGLILVSTLAGALLEPPASRTWT